MLQHRDPGDENQPRKLSPQMRAAFIASAIGNLALSGIDMSHEEAEQLLDVVEREYLVDLGLPAHLCGVDDE